MRYSLYFTRVKDHRSLLDRVLRALKRGGFARFNFPGVGNCAPSTAPSSR
jgi:hypothetical protein